MPKAVSANEVEGRFGALVDWAVEHEDEVIVEHAGQPQAVIMSFAIYEKVRPVKDRPRVEDALATMRRLREQIPSRNRELTEADVDEIADRFSDDVVDGLIEKGIVRFEQEP
jgi:hypothetical protein